MPPLPVWLEGIGAAVHATLDTEQFISHIETTLVDVIASLHGSDRGAIPVSVVLKLLSKNNGILDNAFS